MSLPIIYPIADGPGRLTEICSFKKSAIAPDEFQDVYDSIMKVVRQFPVARQNILGRQDEDKGIAVLMADWTSAAEKDEFEPGEQYQSIKPAFGKLVDSENPSFACHHIILPGNAETPKCAFYTVSHMKIEMPKQQQAASAFQEYLSSGKIAGSLDFLAVASSREDPEVVVCLTGHQDSQSAQKLSTSPEHDKLKSRLDALTSSGTKYGVVI